MGQDSAYMVDKYCRDNAYGVMNVDGRVAMGLVNNFSRSHGDAEG